jgi:hypothetical protein
MTIEEFLLSDEFERLREHAYRENDPLLHNMLTALTMQDGQWRTFEAFFVELIMVMSKARIGVVQQLIENAQFREVPMLRPCYNCGHTPAWTL